MATQLSAGVQIRKLEPEEFESKLSGLPFAQNGIPSPDYSVVLVAETPEGEVVGVWSAMTAVHLEGLWVREDHHHSLVAGRLLRAMKGLLRHLGIFVSFTIVENLDVLCLAHKAGFERINGDLLILRLPPEESVE